MYKMPAQQQAAAPADSMLAFLQELRQRVAVAEHVHVEGVSSDEADSDSEGTRGPADAFSGDAFKT
jgi:hypothetical protein